MLVPTISIDKLSLTAKLDTQFYSNILDYLQTTPWDNEYRHTPWNFLYQHQFIFKHSGLFLQYGIYEKEHIVRLEFNPNKLENKFIKFLHDIMKRLKYPNITRIDWAVDYQGLDMSQYDFRLTTKRKTEEYRSRSGVLETLYLGSRKSDNFIRCYNKAIEQIMGKKKIITDVEEEVSPKEFWWRIEAVVKNFDLTVEQEVERHVEHEEGVMTVEVPRKWYISGKNLEGRMIVKEYDLQPEKKEIKGVVRVKKKEKVKYEYLFQNPFDNLEVYKRTEQMNTKGLNTQEKAMLFYLQHNPTEWDTLSRNTRNKYENLLYAYAWEYIENQPKEVFEKEKNRLAETLEELLKPALDNSTYLTGSKSNLHYSIEYLRYLEKKNIDK